MTTQVYLVLGLLSAICSGAAKSDGGEWPPVLDIGQRFVASGWIGDGQASTECIQQIEACRENPHSVPICTKVIYSKFGSFGWGGVYWQNSPDNWGQEPGWDLSKAGYKSITFWAKGEKGGEYVEFLAGGIEREDPKPPENKYKDSFFATSGKVFLTREWQKHYIDLEGKDLSSVIGGFCWVATQTGNLNGPTFYIDDMCFTREQTPKLDYLDVGGFFTASGWMGDGGPGGRQHIRLDEACSNNPHSLPGCIKVAYIEYGSKRWGGIYWQNRQDNWGDKPGWDLSKTGYTCITFWARGDRGDEMVEFKAGGIHDRTKRYKDSFEVSLGRIPLTREWQQHRINLEGKDLSSVIGGFCWVASQPANPDGLTFYLDDIRFER